MSQACNARRMLVVIHKNSCGRGECVVRKVGNGCLSFVQLRW